MADSRDGKSETTKEGVRDTEWRTGPYSRPVSQTRHGVEIRVGDDTMGG